MTNPLHVIYRNFGKVLTAHVVVAVCGFLALSMNSRALGVTELGYLFVIQATCELPALVLGLQSWQMMIRFGSEAVHENDAKRLRSIWRFGFLLDRAAAAGAAIVASLILILLPQVFGLDPDVARLGIVYAILLAFGGTGTSIGALRLHDAFGTVVIVQIIGAVTQLANAALLFRLEAPLAVYLLTIPAINAASSLVMIGLSYSRNRKAAALLAKGDCEQHRAISRVRLLRFALALSATGTISAFQHRGELLLVSSFLGPSAAALFGVAMRLAALLSRVGEAGRQSVYPELSRRIVQRRFAEAVALAYRLSLYGLILSVPAFCLIVLFAGDILALLFGEQYRAAEPNLILVGVGTSIYVATFSLGPLVQVALGAGQFVRCAFVAFAGAIIAAVGGVLVFGQEGAGAGFATYVLLLTAGLLWLIETRRKPCG